MKNIVYIANKKYLPYFKLSLISLLKKQKNKVYNIELIHYGLDNKDIETIISINNEFSKTSHINFHSYDDYLFKHSSYEKKLKEFSVRNNRNYESILMQFAKIASIDIIGKNIKSAVYIDSDMLIIKNIDSIFNKWFTNNTLIQAVTIGKQQFGLFNKHDFNKFIKNNGFQSKQEYFDVLEVKNKNELKNYFNSGFMHLNIEKLKQEDLINKTFELLANKKITSFDQDIFFILFKDRIQHISSIWNFIWIYINLSIVYKFFTRKIIHLPGKEVKKIKYKNNEIVSISFLPKYKRFSKKHKKYLNK